MRPATRLRLPTWMAVLAVVGAGASVVTRPAAAHPIDEVQSEALVQLTTPDRQQFEMEVVLSASHLQEYAERQQALGLPDGSDREALAASLQAAFAFPPCTIAQVAPQERFVEHAGGSWLGVRFALHCPTPQTQLELVRNQFSRDKTRTTLLWTVALGNEQSAEALLPPHVERATLSLQTGLLVKSERGQRYRPLKDTAAGGHQPTDVINPADVPAPGEHAAWIRPPNALLLAWAQEGTLHLLFGPDHLLFLLTLVLAGRRLGRTALAVSGFSLGHLTSMALAMRMQWPPVPFLDVIIGGTIAWSAWSARKDAAQPLWQMVGTATGFGLIHGLGFGSGLQALTGGVDAIWWPLLAFGVGLDLAQLAWVALAAGVWQLVRGTGERAARAQRLAAQALVGCGALAGVLALVREVVAD